MAAPKFDGFTEYDFDLFTRDKWRSETYNEPRLKVRRKLGALGKLAEARFVKQKTPLAHKTSLHNPSKYNRDCVRSIKAYFARDKSARKALKQIFGPVLGKDLDPHYNNTQLWIKVQVDGIEFSMSIHPSAWWDAETFRQVCSTRNGRSELCDLLRPLPDYHLKMHDWKKLYPCERLQPDELAEIVKVYKPAEHWLHCYRMMPAEAVVEAGADFAELVWEELSRLLPAYFFMTWSPDRNLIFGEK